MNVPKTLTVATIAAAAALQGCAGGAITDGSGNRITGNATADMLVTFQNTSTGTSYTTGVDTTGYFGFDPYAPGTASNDAVVLPGGTYKVTVGSRSGLPSQVTPFTIQNEFNDQDCPDHYTGGHEPCALYQVELLGGAVATPPAPYAGNYLGFATTVIPVSSGTWCQQVKAGFGVTNESVRYNDIAFQTFSATDVTWGWAVTSGNLAAQGTLPAGSHGGSGDLAESFVGPPYYVYPNTSYTVSFYAGGLGSSCTPISVTFETTSDPVPSCVVDHDCPVDPGDGDDGSDQGDCSPGVDCCPSGYCSDPDQPDPPPPPGG